VVETVGGFCDAIIRRNTPVPCEQSRVFVTAVDGQTAVRVRVGQGVSTSFADNTLLGEVLLDALQPAPRGHVQVEVTFSLNTDGMLSVRAVDVATQRATTARLRLEGLPDAAEIARLQQRHAALPTM
jgi:molecular chaperone DnaK